MLMIKKTLCASVAKDRMQYGKSHNSNWNFLESKLLLVMQLLIVVQMVFLSIGLSDFGRLEIPLKDLKRALR